MAQPGKNKLSRFWKELKRRKVIRVITVYAASAFVILELVSIISDPFGLPEWTLKFVFVLLCIGFIISVVLSWVYDITPDGIEKTKPVREIKEDIPEKSARLMVWKVATITSIVVIIGLIGLNIVRTNQRSDRTRILNKSIAVLPFENMSDDNEFSHLGDALTDEIIMQLYKVNEFEVRSRTSVMQYRNTEKSSPLIGNELNVSYLLEGSTQRYEEQVRIRVQLIQASTDDHIWGDVFEGEWKDIFDIQISVAKRVAHELKTALSDEETDNLEKKPTDNYEAYNLYLKGRYFWNKRTKSDLEKSISIFEEAIQLDSTYALAYSGLADSYIVLGEWSIYPTHEVFPKAKKAALKAIELDYGLAEAHCALAAIKRDYDWDWKGSEKEYRKAIELNPKYPTAYQWYAELLSDLGRHDEAIANMKHAQDLDPLSPILYTMAGHMIYFNSRQHEKAILQCMKALEIDSNYIYAHEALARNYLVMEMYEDALDEVHKAMLLSVDEIISPKTLMAQIYGYSGQTDEALKMLNELKEISDTIFIPDRQFAEIYLSIGMKENAMELLEKSYSEKDYSLIHINSYPYFDELRRDPKFIDLLKRMNFKI